MLGFQRISRLVLRRRGGDEHGFQLARATCLDIQEHGRFEVGDGVRRSVVAC